MFGLFHLSGIPTFYHIILRPENKKKQTKKTALIINSEPTVYAVFFQCMCVTALPDAVHNDAGTVLNSSSARVLLIVMIKMRQSVFALFD